MDEHRDIPEPGELVYQPRPSLAPPVFAFALALAVVGVYAEHLLVRGWIYAIIGVVVALAFLRVIVRGSVADFYRLPRKQRTRGAVLPVSAISPPKS